MISLVSCSQFTIENNTVNPFFVPVLTTSLRPSIAMANNIANQGLPTYVTSNPRTGNPYGIDWNHNFFH